MERVARGGELFVKRCLPSYGKPPNGKNAMNVQCNSEQKENRIAKAFAFTTSVLILKTIAIAGSERLYNMNGQLNMIIAGLTVVLFAFVFWKNGNIVFNKKQFLLFAAIIFFWGVTYIVNPIVYSYSYAEEEISFFFVYAIPALLFLPMLSTCEVLLKEYYRYRWVFLIVSIMTVFLMLRNGIVQGSGTRAAQYSMSFGRALILPTLLFLSCWFDKRKAYDFIGAIILTSISFLFASRFPLLCIFAYYAWKELGRKKTKKEIAILFLVFLLVITVVFFGEMVSSFLYELLRKFGITSRSLLLILSGSFSYDDGRILLYSEMLSIINTSPVFGFGAFGGNYITENGLSHSFFIDLFANLGYFFGGILLILSAVKIYKNYRQNTGLYTKDFMIICLCQFLPTSIIQTSLWRATYYWYLIALCLGRLNDNGGVTKYENY